METRIMFLIVALLVIWLLFSPKGKQAITKFILFMRS